VSYHLLRKPLLVAHIGTSVGLLGAVLVFFCLSALGIAMSDPKSANAFYAVMPQVTWLVIVPLAVASTAIGILQSLLSPWGLIRHYWVVLKLVMTVLITAVLLLQTGTIDRLGAIAARASLEVPDTEARYSVLLHSGAGFLALLVVLILSVVKPQGLTGWSRRTS
jgi:hypothetical protein